MTAIVTAVDRLHEHANAWCVGIEEVEETQTSLIAYGRRDGRDVVLKVVKTRSDEWDSGAVLRAFDGRGVVPLHEHAPGACLMQRLRPGTSLVEVSHAGRDDEAIDSIARIIGSMQPTVVPEVCPTVQHLGLGFTWYRSIRDSQIAGSLMDHAESVFSDLVRTQRGIRLLHGDLQHSNVLLDADLGWLAIDPKGVVGEVEYEVASVLRNPREIPALVLHPAAIERRIDRLTSALELDRARVVGWAFAQAVLSLVWSVQDGARLQANDPSRLLADAMGPLLRGVGL